MTWFGFSSRTTLKNIVVKGLSVPIEKASRFLLIIVAAPTLGAAAFGRFQFADIVTGLLVLATELGLGVWTTRALARAPHDARAIVATGFSIRGLAAAPYLLLVVGAAVIVGRGETRTALLLLGVAALAGAFIDHCDAVFRGYERLEDEARLNVVKALLITAAGLVAVVWWRSLAALCVGILLGSAIAGVYGLSIVRRRYRLATPLGWRGLDAPLARAAVVEALPLWLATLLSLVYFKGDAVLLRIFAGDAAVGSYAAAYKLFEGTMVLPSVILAASFPGLVRAGAAARDPQGLGDPRHRRRAEVGLGATLLGLGAAVGAGLYLASALVIRLAFGRGFEAAVASLRVLCLAVPLVFVNYGLTHFLIARHLERRNLLFAMILVLLNVGMNLLLIPRQGGRGAAWATFGTEVALTIFCLLTLVASSEAAPPRRPTPAAGT